MENNQLTTVKPWILFTDQPSLASDSVSSYEQDAIMQRFINYLWVFMRTIKFGICSDKVCTYVFDYPLKQKKMH
jgi:hypothetical protein